MTPQPKKEVSMRNILISILVLILLFPSAAAWARHDLMTEEVVEDLGWLDRFDNITVTEYLYDDPTINDNRIRYYNEDPGQLEPDEFYYHALYEPVLFYKGAQLGNSTTAKTILIEFSDEPDWEMDQELQLSWMQGFSGESQGYRHMYYPTWSFHIPLGFMAQGQTPDRAQHFYDRAKMAFEKGDTYWGFRFLARAMHYVQDMSQPFHTRQFYWRYINLKDPYHGTIQAIKNYHFAYESYIANEFRLEQEGVLPNRLITPLRYSLPVPTDSPADLAKYIARRSHWRSSKTWKNSIDFFGEKYLSAEGEVMTEQEFFSLIQKDSEAAEEFYQDTENRMVLFGKATKSFLEFARKDINLDQYRP